MENVISLFPGPRWSRTGLIKGLSSNKTIFDTSYLVLGPTFFYYNIAMEQPITVEGVNSVPFEQCTE